MAKKVRKKFRKKGLKIVAMEGDVTGVTEATTGGVL